MNIGRIIQRDDAPPTAPQGAHPTAKERKGATLRSVSIANLWLLTEGKLFKIEVFLGIQI